MFDIFRAKARRAQEEAERRELNEELRATSVKLQREVGALQQTQANLAKVVDELRSSRV